MVSVTNYDRKHKIETGVAFMGSFTGTGQTGPIVKTNAAGNANACWGGTRPSAANPSVLTVQLQGRFGPDCEWLDVGSPHTNTSFALTTGLGANTGAVAFPTATIKWMMPEMRVITTGTWTGSTGPVLIWMAWS